VTETEFNQTVDAIFARIEDALDARDTDIDYETSAGILTLEFEDGSKIIINRQTPIRWLPLPSRSERLAQYAGRIRVF